MAYIFLIDIDSRRRGIYRQVDFVFHLVANLIHDLIAERTDSRLFHFSFLLDGILQFRQRLDMVREIEQGLYLWDAAVEFLEGGLQLGRDITTTDYIIWGGFPKRLEYNSERGQRIYLNELNETIILNDIINRYHIRKTEVFKRLANYIFLSNGRILSARSVEKYMRGAGLPCSVTTITKYIGYLEEAYAIATVKRYSGKTKRELEYYLKVYDEDVAFNSIRIMNNRYDLTHNFENVVYNELIYMGYSLQVYNDGSHEIDFIAVL